jgi:hypothetical protein
LGYLHSAILEFEEREEFEGHEGQDAESEGIGALVGDDLLKPVGFDTLGEKNPGMPSSRRRKPPRCARLRDRIRTAIDDDGQRHQIKGVVGHTLLHKLVHRACSIPSATVWKISLPAMPNARF